MDVFLPECQYLPSGLKVAARLKDGWKALALPEDAPAVLQEVLKFLATTALITVTGLILLMAG